MTICGRHPHNIAADIHVYDVCSVLQLHATNRDGPLVRLVNYGYLQWSYDKQVYKDYLWSVVDGEEHTHQPMILRPSGAPLPAAVPDAAGRPRVEILDEFSLCSSLQCRVRLSCSPMPTQC